MALTSIILIVDRYFEDEEIIFDNLSNANSSVELLIYNHGGKVSNELKDLSSKYIEDNFAFIEKPFAECVNSLLPYCSGDKICILYNYAYLPDDWLCNLNKTYDRVVNSGVISVRYDNDLQTNFFLNDSDELEKHYFDNNRVSGMMFFSNEILNRIGKLNTNLHGKYCLYEYCYRVGLLGKYNYYDINNHAILISTYTTTYIANQKQYLAEISNVKPFQALHKHNDHSKMLDALKILNIECDYSPRLDKIVIIDKEFDSSDFSKIKKLCDANGYDYKIVGTGYFENYIFKARTGIFLNKLL